MSLSILNQVQHEVRRHPLAYAEARERHAALAPYATVEAILARVNPSVHGEAGEKSALLCALVTEAQRTRHPLWTALLLTAFAPMLRTIRRRTIPCSGETPDDVEQRVVGGFLQAVQTVKPAHARLGLRWATQRAAWAVADGPDERKELLEESPSAEHAEDEPLAVDVALRAMALEGEPSDDESLDEVCGGACENPLAEQDAMIDRITARDIARELLAKGQEELLEALMCAGDDKDSLRDFVDRKYGALPSRERAAKYQRLAVEQTRAVRRLRARLARRAA
jgi:hypothetical protein